MSTGPFFEGPHNEASALITEVSLAVYALWPKEMTGGVSEQVAMRVFARMRTRYQNVGLLLAFDQPDDAWTLLRGLMGDSQRLQILAQRVPERTAIAVTWWEAAVTELEDRAAAADAVGERTFADTIRRAMATQRRSLGALRAELVAQANVRLPKDGSALARAAGHPEDYLDWVISSDPAHGALPTSLWHDRLAPAQSPDDPPGVHVGGNDDPQWRMTVADRATRHYLRAGIATATICALPILEQLIAYMAAITKRLDDDVERNRGAEQVPYP